jgi:anti-sigma regulatory factor (Ser/Thr protein kinase)
VVQRIRLPLEHGTPASVARRVAERALRGWGLTERADDVLLITTELVQNVTKHTDDGGELVLSLHGDAILIEVADTSPQPPRLQPPADRRLGGRGLMLVAAVASDWGCRGDGDGKVVWAEVPQHP